MATAAQIKIAKAYARDIGLKEGERYSPFVIFRVSLAAHRGHGLVAYRGINNGHLEFRCDCSDTIFVLAAR
jgi:hypothetical protein